MGKTVYQFIIQILFSNELIIKANKHINKINRKRLKRRQRKYKKPGNNINENYYQRWREKLTKWKRKHM